MPIIENNTILITGTNRGIGRALVAEALARGAQRVYAAARQPVARLDERVVPVLVDVTDVDQIQHAAGQVEHLDILINNAGVASYDTLDERAAIEAQLGVNLFGTYEVTRAFLPHLVTSRGAVVNNISLNALAPLPVIAGYSISKAALLSMTQSLRAIAGAQGVSVHAVLTGPVDTDMSRGADIPKASAAAVAAGIFDGIVAGEEEIFPDTMAQSLAEGWRDGPAKSLERQYAAIAAALTA